MTTYEFGDVVLVPFPFTDQSASKRRPAVVISSTRYQGERPDLLLMAITSQLRSPGTVGERLVSQWKDAGLLKASMIKPIITTVERSIVIRRMGRLQEADRSALKESLREILG